jgi:hypothetical protein
LALMIMSRAKTLKALVVLTIFAIAVAASLKAGTPAVLPSAALDWTALFHIERAAAVLGAIGLVLLIGWRAMSGEFPIKFGNVEYAVENAATKAEQAAEEQEHRIRVLEVLAGVRDISDLDADQ